MPTVKCVHCSAVNDPIQTSGYCEECGKRLPGGVPFSSGPPRPVQINAAASEQRERVINRASGILLAVAFLQLICSGLFIAVFPMLQKNQPRDPNTIPFVLGTAVGVFIVFLLLALWARFQPLPPSAIGLVIYVSLAAVDLIVSGGNIVGILIKVFIIVGLTNAVIAASKTAAHESKS